MSFLKVFLDVSSVTKSLEKSSNDLRGEDTNI